MCLASFAFAVEYAYDESVITEGPLLDGSVHTPAAQKVYETAYDNAVNRSTIYFYQDSNYTNPNSEFTSLPWNWTVGIAAVAVPAHENDLGNATANYTSDLRFVSTQWHLGFPTIGNKSLNELLYDTQSALRVNALYISSPAIVGRTFSQNGNCSHILGASCLQSLTNEAAFGSQQFDQQSLAKNCSDKLAQQLAYSNSPFTIEPYNASTAANASTRGLIYSGGPLYFWESPTWSPRYFDTALEHAEGVLQILILTPESRSSAPRGNLMGPTVLCTVTDPTKISAAGPMRAASVLLALLVSSLAAAAVMW